MQQEVIEGYPLSPQQEYVWLLSPQEVAAYRTQCALRLEGELEKSFLQEALQQVIAQHEILRTAFRSIPGMSLPLQVILEEGTWSWREVDLRQFAEEEQSSQLAALQRSESEREFNHEQGEVLYACLVLLGPTRHVLLLNISPLCADSWSLQNLLRELGRRYTAHLAGAEVALEAVQYADFSEWQHELLNTEASAGRDFWRKQNVSDLPVLKLPLEKDAGTRYWPEYIPLKSDAELVQELEALAQAYGVSLSVLLLAAWWSLLWRLTGERELVVGAAVDGSRYKELHDSLGPFTKYLPVPLRFVVGASFQEIIKRVATSYGEVYRRQEYYTPGAGRAAEEGMGYEYEEREETVAGYGPLRVAVISEQSCRSRQRVLLQCRYQKAAKRLELRLRYDAGCYSPAMIKLLAERLETWLQTVARAPRAELSRVTLLGEAERGLLREWGTGAVLERVEACETLGEMLEQQARRQGETAAVVGGDEVLTFSELNARANQLGRYLRKRGIGPEAVVGILLERSSRLVECVCGVWKAGGAYLPLHPGTPPARLERVLKQAGVRLVVSERDLAGLVAGTGVEVIEWEAVVEAVRAEKASEPEVAVSGENLAYVIYTSGSTGEPKGVMIEQRSVLHLLGGLRQEVYGEHDEQCVRIGMNAPLSFDASVKQLVQVLRGKTLVVIPEELRLEAGALLSYLAQQEVDVLDCTPAQLRLLRAEAGAGAQWPRLLLIGGEAIDGELWQQLGNWSETDSVNLYGPTEATVDTTWKRVSGLAPSIGKPLPQVRVYLLDQHGEQVAIGQVGEVYIGGRGLARGYRHAAELTAERFVPDNYGDEIGARLYRTGDLARYREDGELEYVGRTDRQVKLRGFRIELEEVEAALLEHEAVKAAAAMVRRDEEKEERLVAYVVPKRQQAAIIEGRPRHRLPNGMFIVHQNRSETDYLYEEIFNERTYCKHGVQLKPGACVFDVGANIGMFTLFVGQQVPDARVYAFEPIKPIFDTLRINAGLYGSNVKLFPFGLSNEEKTDSFAYYPQFSARSGLSAYANAEDEVAVIKQFLHNKEQSGVVGMGSLLEAADDLLEGVFVSETHNCELKRLSDVIREENVPRIDLLKIDVQQAELDVLLGIDEADWAKIEQVSMEIHDAPGHASEGRVAKIKALLERQGFSVVVEQDDALRGTDRHNLYGTRSPRESLSEATHPLNTAKLEEQVVGGSVPYQLPNKLEVFHQNRNETEFIYHQIFEDQLYLKHGISIKPGDCIFDVGANIGLFTLFVYHQVRNASVYSFEPIPSNFEKLRNNVALYGLDANLFNCGLSDREGTATFTFYPNWSASSGVYANVEEEEEALKTFLINQGELVAEYADELIEGRYKGEQVVCQLRTLSAVIRQHNIERIDLLKLDVEKSEWDVLEGIEPEDWQKIRQVVVEVHDLDGRLERMQQLLSEQGFIVEVEQDAGLVGTNIHSLYARRREAAVELSEVRNGNGNGNGNGTARLRQESVALGVEEADISEAELRRYLRERLPEYMVPQVLVKLERMPLSRHGKIDYQRLPAPAPLEGELEAESARSEVEEMLAGIWREVLGLARVGLEENFFELGGHSLLATQVTSRVREVFGVEVKLRELFERPTVKELSQSIERELRQGTGIEAPPIERREHVEELPLSFAQQRLWFIDQLEPGGAFYNVLAAVRLKGRLNQEALAQTLTEVIRRHEVLRTRFGTVGGRAVQVIEAAAPVELEVLELSELEVEERETRAQEWAAQEVATPFDLSRGPLLRVKLLRLGEQEHVVLLTMHHIVSDGWSAGVLIKEVGALYAAYAAGEESPLPELPIQYADFAVWQRAYLQGEVLEQQLKYWREQLAGAQTVLKLPTDKPRPAISTYRGATHKFVLPEAVTAPLRKLSQEQGCTLFMTLLASFKTLLYRYTEEEDILVGTAIANRNRSETEALIGFFVNTLVLRTDLSGNPSFRELMRRVRETTLGAYVHQDMPFERLVEELQPERSLSHTPIFQILFLLQNAPVGELGLPGLNLTVLQTEHATSKFDLSLVMAEEAGELRGALEYNSDLFDPSTITRMAEHFQTLLDGIVTDPSRNLSELPLLTTPESRLLAEWNKTDRDYDQPYCLHELFEQQVERSPEAVALVFEDKQLTYAELNELAKQLAKRLQQFGIKPETRIGLCVERSFEMVIGLLGILKAGGAYVPLNPSDPSERLSFMVEDSGAQMLLTQKRFGDLLPANRAHVIYLDEPYSETVGPTTTSSVDVCPENLAYVIYTSGSTGQPKGAMNTHQAIVNRLLWMQEAYGLGPADCVLQKTPFTFDVSVWEFFWPLLVGARLVLARPGGHQDPAYLTRLISAEQVTTLHFVPSMLQVFLDEPEVRRCRSLKRVICSGEALPLALQERFFQLCDAELHNLYGPTEAAVDVTFWECERDSERLTVPIGRPIANTQIHLLDRHLRQTPVGVVGELYIGGTAVGRGYCDRPELTAERFTPDPFGPSGARLYKTGDLARYLRDGSIEYLGRVDHQVKLRGLRIELGEIEAVLAQYAAVQEAVVVVKEYGPGDQRLVAYVVGEESLESGELRQYLKGVLPEYMVPQVFVKLERLPLTLNGKVDRRALPAVENVREETEMVPAQTPVEEMLAEIWSEVLGLAQIGREEHFFELGGHSLLATQVMSRVREAFGVEVRLRELFERPTVKELGQSIERELRQGAGVSAPPIERRERVGELPLSFAQQRLWFIDQLAPGGTVYNIPVSVRLSGTLNVMALEQTLNEIIRRHEVLRTSFAVVDEQPVQVIASEVSLSLTMQDLRGLPEPEREAEVIRLADAEAHTPFDLGQAPLLRVKLLRVSESEHVVLLTMHHIITDGWSMGVLIKEVAALYRAFAQGEPVSLPELPVQYADFAIWQRERLAGEELERQLCYWQQQLAGTPAILALPADRPRPPLQTFNGAEEAFTLSAESTQALHRLSRSRDVTLFMTLLAVWQVLLHRYSGQKDIVVGTSIANRNRSESERLIGFFVNMLVLRTNVSGDPTFFELLKRVKEVCLGAYAHQDLPFEKLVEELQPERSLNHAPLFQVVFVLQNAPVGALEVPGLVLNMIEPKRDEAQFDLTLGMQEVEGKLSGTLRYNTDLFEAETIKRMLGHLHTLLAAAVADPAQQLSRLPLLTEEEEQQLADWNNTRREYPRDACIHQLFEAQVERTPDAVAVSIGEQEISYRELNTRANQLANYLQGLGIGPESLVALYLDRSAEMVIAILAILKAGAAYLPLDLSSPAERVSFMLQDAGASVLVTQDRFLCELSAAGAVKRVCLDTDQATIAEQSAAPPDSGIGPENLAYVMYTSGSTGQPKGVSVIHRSVVRLVKETNYIDVSASDVFLQSAPISFDASTFELWGSLLNGARLVLLEQPRPTLEELARAISSNGVTVLWLTAGLFHLMVEEQGSALLGVRRMLAGGDVLAGEQVRKYLAQMGAENRLLNGYGPTENTTFTCCHQMARDSRWQGTVPIGKPIANTTVYILDQQQRVVPVGVYGEIYAGGDGLARGYMNDAALTAEKFVPHPFSEREGERLYRTGDIGRWLKDGSIEFVGRADHQVKLRGFRIELGEIEAVLAQYAAVQEAVVVVKEYGPGDQRLVAYVVGEESLESGELRQYLKGVLPEYMVPQVFVKLERLPLTENGKVDRRALPAVENMREETEIVPAQTPVEEMLVGIWSEVLGVPVGVEDDFFALGGHSLLATQVMSRVQEVFGVEVGLRELFERPTVKELGQSIERELRQGVGVSAPPIERRERVGELPLSFAQQRLWFIDQFEPGAAVYNVPVAIKLTGALDIEALQRSLTEIVRRHEVLRTSFANEDGRPVQVIHPAAPVKLPLIELSHLRAEEREEQVRQAAQAEAAQLFDLSHGPLLRAQLLRLSESEHVVLFTMHHIVSDGWSIAVLIKEAGALYSAFTAGAPSPLEELSIQYADFAVWQRAYLQGERLEQQLAYWRRQLHAAPTVLNLPIDHLRPAMQEHRGALHLISLPAALSESLKELSRRKGVTLYMTLLGAFSHLLQRYTHADELLIGAPIAGRNHREIEQLIGIFVNTLVLRVDLSADPSFGELIGRVRRVCLDAYAHQEVPFEKLVEELQPERSLSHTPFFQVMFGLQNTPQEELKLPGLSLNQIELRAGVAKFDLVLDLRESINGIEGFFEYNTHMFESATIERMATHLRTLLEAIVAEPEQRLSSLSLLTAAEEQQVKEWNPTGGEYPREHCLQQLFEAQVERTPEAAALVWNEETLSYGELNRRANQLAHHLRRLRVGPESVVGILLERSIEMMCSVLAVLKTGGAYLPLDLSYPAERLAFMLRDAGVKVLISQERFAGELPVPEAQVVLLDKAWQFAEYSSSNPEVEMSPDNLAYVIYTSGSTGQPKATLIPHSAVVSSNWAVIERYGLGQTDRVLQFAALSFDVSVEEMFPTWFSGGCVVLRPEGLLDSHAEGWDFLRRARITVVNLPTTYWSELIAARPPREARNGDGELSLRLVAIGEELVERFVLTQEVVGPEVRLCNVYGLTETTVTSLTQDFGALERGARSVPLGKPLANSQVYVLDRQQRVAPVGVSGEIYIGGNGLARGYLNRPELTAERFVPHPFSERAGERLYRTGDVGRWLNDGSIEFLGRVDHQVKLRGFRVELGEIESVLSRHEAVREAVVVVQTVNDDERLVAYVVGEESFESGELRQYLKGVLPEYMVPQVFVQLERLPLTASGKVDRRALQAAENVREETEQIVPAQTPVEEVLVGIWSEVLGVPVGIEDDFFALGGHSLLATQVMSRVREAFRVEIALRELFERPTVKELGQSIERELRRGAGLSAPPIERRERVGALPLSFAQQRLWFIDQLEPGGVFYNVPAAVRLKGSLNKEALAQTFSEVIRRHEVLRTRFDTVDGRAVQVIEAAAPVELEVVESSELEVTEREARVREFAAQEAATPFDLSRGPLLRVKLLRLGEQEHVALLTMHHIVSDGWSVGVLINEVGELYAAYAAGQESPLPELRIQYADFAVWQRAYLQGEVLEQQLKYWREQLAGAQTTLKLPTDKARPAIYSYRGATHKFVLPVAVTAPLRKLSQEQGCTLFMTLLASFKTLLYRYTEQEDILVGTAIANRNRSETEDLIGFFVNTLVLRTDLSGNPSFRKLMQRVRETTLGAYVHQDMPFEKLVEELQPERSLSQASLFQVAFGVNNAPVQTLTLPGLELSQMDFDFDAGRFDLTLWMSEYQDELSGIWYYNTDLFEAATIKRMQGHFETILENVLAQPDLPLSEIEMLTEDEKKQKIVQKQERLESNAQVLRTIRRKGISIAASDSRSN